MARFNEGENSEDVPRISTSEFLEVINGIGRNSTTSGPLARYTIEGFDQTEFLEGLNLTGYEVVPSRDGLVSTIKVVASPGDDNSRKTDALGWHQDGLAGPMPELGILHCVNPGKVPISTVFADTSRLWAQLTPEQQEAAKHRDLVYYTMTGERQNTLPLVDQDPFTGQPVVHLGVGERVRLQQRAGSPRSRISDSQLLETLHEAAAASVDLNINWRTGLIVVWGNFKYVHARQNLSGKSDPQRELTRFGLRRRPL